MGFFPPYLRKIDTSLHSLTHAWKTTDMESDGKLAFSMTKMHRTVDNERGYCLELANGLGWVITVTKGVESWVEKFASILELTASGPNGHPRLIFIPYKAEGPGCGDPAAILDSAGLKDLPQVGWTKQKAGALRFWFHADVPDVICEIGSEEDHDLDIAQMWLALGPIYKRAQESGGLPLHAALVEWNRAGILLAGRGDTGKSTSCGRLPSPWQAVCDDETLIVRDNHNRYLAHPFPTWSDHMWRGSEKTWNVQKHLPLSALFFLERADTDKVVSLSQSQAAVSINESATEVCRRNWRNLDREGERKVKKQVFENACELAKGVPAFRLRFSLNGRFWEEIEKVL
jgi:SynChlorMet cassette protein ScmC